MRGIFLGLGSNCGDCSRLLRDAVVLLEERGVVVMKKSSIYETEPVIGEWQDSEAQHPNFLNAVVEVETDLPVTDLLRVCREVEVLLGRVRREGDVRWSARTMDIDILLYGDEVIGWTRAVDTPASDRMGVATFIPAQLVVPHPRMHERNFVLVPLVEVLGELADTVIHPALHVSILELLRRCGDIHRVAVSLEKW